MVVLNRIYTRTGDDGSTALGSGERRPKYDLRVAAYGTVDEINAAIGVARALIQDPSICEPADRRDLGFIGLRRMDPEVECRKRLRGVATARKFRLGFDPNARARWQAPPCVRHVVSLGGRTQQMAKHRSFLRR